MKHGELKMFTIELTYPNNTKEYFNLSLLEFGKELKRLQSLYTKPLKYKILELQYLEFLKRSMYV